jgi:membrane protein required for beta-lactamase induction
MAEDATPRWDEVGERFTRLGHTLKDRWDVQREESGAEPGAGDPADTSGPDQVRSALDGVSASLDGLAAAITGTVQDAEVHDAARAAAGGLVDALSASLGDLADRIQTRKD